MQAKGKVRANHQAVESHEVHFRPRFACKPLGSPTVAENSPVNYDKRFDSILLGFTASSTADHTSSPAGTDFPMSGPESDRQPQPSPGEILARLMETIVDRRENPPPKSYTSSLFAAGLPKIGKKLLEEAGEAVEAAGEAGDQGRTHLIYEAGDLIYHLFVLLAHNRVPLSDVEAELASRFGVSGIDEKNARSQKGEAAWQSAKKKSNNQQS